jgi:hypothetical protein
MKSNEVQKPNFFEVERRRGRTTDFNESFPSQEAFDSLKTQFSFTDEQEQLIQEHLRALQLVAKSKVSVEELVEEVKQAPFVLDEPEELEEVDDKKEVKKLRKTKKED